MKYRILFGKTIGQLTTWKMWMDTGG